MTSLHTQGYSVISHADFTLVRIRAAAFSAREIDAPSVRVLTEFLSKYKERFDKSPSLLPEEDKLGRMLLPPEMPLITLASKQGDWSLTVAKSRVDVFRAATVEEKRLPASALYTECSPVLDQFIEQFDVEVGRLGTVFERYCVTKDPGGALARYFCQERWTGADDPLSRPQGFELHAHKVFELTPGLAVNSWVRCKTGVVTGAVEGPAIIVEQDINTLVGDKGQKFSKEQRDTFFKRVSDEVERILISYFPGDANGGANYPVEGD